MKQFTSNSILGNLPFLQQARTFRTSSWDQNGKNQDYWLIPPGESVVLADIEGPGCITHLWLTQFCREILGPSVIDPVLGSQVAPVFEIHNALGVTWERADPFYYRKILFKIYWDDQDIPGVLAPLGDFFCVGHSMPNSFASFPFTVSAKLEESHIFGGSASLNCYLPMPFNKRAKVVVENQNTIPYGQYFHIDFELYRDPLPENTGYLHTCWHRENPCDGWGPHLQVNTPEANSAANVDGKGNYVILETEGEGHYIGCNLSVTHFQGSWWGEGDDMIFIDDDTWPPSLHGTGSEDYFNHAWGMQKNAFPMHGSIIHESVVPGYQVSYRFHLTDPIHFSQKIKVTMEHGHANHLSDDWSSTAYWYQKLPSPKLSILPVERRFPPVKNAGTQPRASLPSSEERAILERFEQRRRDYLKARENIYQERYKKTRAYEAANIEFCKKIRERMK